MSFDYAIGVLMREIEKRKNFVSKFKESQIDWDVHHGFMAELEKAIAILRSPNRDAGKEGE